MGWRCKESRSEVDPTILGRLIARKSIMGRKPVCPWHKTKQCVVSRYIHHVDGCDQFRFPQIAERVRTSDVGLITCDNCRAKLKRLGLIHDGLPPRFTACYDDAELWKKALAAVAEESSCSLEDAEAYVDPSNHWITLDATTYCEVRYLLYCKQPREAHGAWMIEERLGIRPDGYGGWDWDDNRLLEDG
jgi:hypothetical protein